LHDATDPTIELPGIREEKEALVHG
jgi:hypothetical protein